MEWRRIICMIPLLLSFYAAVALSSSRFPKFIEHVYRMYAKDGPHLQTYLDNYIHQYDQLLTDSHALSEEQLESLQEVIKRETLVQKWDVLERLLRVPFKLNSLLELCLQSELQQIVFTRNIMTTLPIDDCNESSLLELLECFIERQIVPQSKIAVDHYVKQLKTAHSFMVNYVEKRWQLGLQALLCMSNYVTEKGELDTLVAIFKMAVDFMNAFYNRTLNVHAQRHRSADAKDRMVNWELRGIVKMSDENFMKRVESNCGEPTTSYTLPLDLLMNASEFELRERITDINRLKTQLVGCKSPVEVLGLSVGKDELYKKALMLGEKDVTSAKMNSSMLSFYLLSSPLQSDVIDHIADGVFEIDDKSCGMYVPKGNVVFITNTTDSTTLVFSDVQFQPLPQYLGAILDKQIFGIDGHSLIRMHYAIGLIGQAVQSWLFELYQCTFLPFI